MSEKSAVGDKRSAPDAPDSDFKAPVVIGHSQENDRLAAQGAQLQAQQSGTKAYFEALPPAKIPRTSPAGAASMLSKMGAHDLSEVTKHGC
jgi:hypothetical protein